MKRKKRKITNLLYKQKALRKPLSAGRFYVEKTFILSAFGLYIL